MPGGRKEVKMDEVGILDQAKNIVTGKRREQYGKAERNFAKIAQFWTIYLQKRLIHPIKAEDVGIMMALMKIARQMSKQYSNDNFVDACGYLALSGALMEEGERNAADTVE